VPLRPVSELGLVDITEVPARDRTATPRVSTRARTSPSQPVRNDPPSGNEKKTMTRGRSESERASRGRKPDPARRASKDLAGPPQADPSAKGRSAAPAKRRDRAESPRASTPKSDRKAPATAGRSGGKPKPRRTSESPAASSPRPRSRSTAATASGSGAKTRSSTNHPAMRPNGSAGPPRTATSDRRPTSAGSRPKTNPPSRQTQRSRNTRGHRKTKPSPAARIGISVLMGASLIGGGLLFARTLHR
jgi:hypothetical protein